MGQADNRERARTIGAQSESTQSLEYMDGSTTQLIQNVKVGFDFAMGSRDSR